MKLKVVKYGNLEMGKILTSKSFQKKDEKIGKLVNWFSLLNFKFFHL